MHGKLTASGAPGTSMPSCIEPSLLRTAPIPHCLLWLDGCRLLASGREAPFRDTPLLAAGRVHAGFRHGRYGRPIPFIPPPESAFRSADVDATVNFFRREAPIYLTWDAESNCPIAYSESAHFFAPVRSRSYIRYSPFTGEAIAPPRTGKNENWALFKAPSNRLAMLGR